jgi:hypothetical protein
MNFDKFNSIVSRIFFFGAFFLFALAVLERVALSLGVSLLMETFEPGRLLEYATILMVFVIAILLRQIRGSSRRRA